MAANSLKLQVVLDTVDKVTGKFKVINESSTRLSKTLRTARDNLKDLESKQRSLAKHRDLEIRVATTAQKMQQQQRALHALQNAYNSTAAPSKKLTKELLTQSVAVGKLTRLEQAQRSELTQSRATLAAAGLGTDKLAHHQDRLAREITDATRQIDKQKTALDKLGAAQKRAAGWQSSGASMMVKGTAAYAGGSMALQRIGAATTPGVQLQSQVRDIAITGGFNQQQEAALATSIRSDAVKFGQTTEMIAEGLQGLVANGISDNKQLAAYSALMAKSSVATGAEMNDLAQLITTNSQTFGIGASDMQKALDSMAYAGKRGSFELRDMAKWFPALAPQLKALGVTGHDAVSSLGAALQVARKGAGGNDEAANNLANYLKQLTAPSTIAAFDKAGINLEKSMLDMARKGIDPLQGSLQLITRYMESKGPGAALKFKEAISIEDAEKRAAAFESLSNAFNLGELFRDAQALNFLRPALANQGEMQDIKSGASEAKGGIDADWQKRMGTAQKKLDLFQIKLNELKLKAFDVLAPSLNELADKVGIVFDKVGAFVSANPVLSSWFIKAAAGFALLLTVVGAVLIPLGFMASAIGNIMGLLATLRGAAIGGKLLNGISKLGPVFTFLRNVAGRALLGIGRFAMIAGRMFLASPLGLAIGLLAGAAYLVWKNWDGMKAGAILLWQDICTGVSNAWEWLKGKMLALWGYISGLWDRFKTMGSNLLQGLIAGLLGGLGAAKDAIMNVGGKVIGWLKEKLGIHSPSRVFAQLGGFTMAGFTQGLLGGENGAQAAVARIGTGLRKAGAGLALGTLTASTALAANVDHRPPLAAAARAGAGGGGDTYNITINAPAGAQAQDIAALVRAEIERLEHQNRARRRAELSDYE